MSATPRPWKFELKYADGSGVFLGPDGRSVAAISGNIKRPREEKEANAALIVHAVNTLEVMEEAKVALELARVCFNRVLGTGADASTDIRFHALMAQADLQAKAVLVKLDGGK